MRAPARDWPASPAGYNFSRAGIAQLVEQRFCKPLVVGSIPTAGTKPFERRAGAPRWGLQLSCASGEVPEWLAGNSSTRARSESVPTLPLIGIGDARHRKSRSRLIGAASNRLLCSAANLGILVTGDLSRTRDRAFRPSHAMQQCAAMPSNLAATAAAEIRALVGIAIWTQFGFLGFFVSVASIALHVLGALEIGSSVALLASGVASGAVAFDRVRSLIAGVDARGRVREVQPPVLTGVTDRTVAL